jgi:hypothetical protein
MNKQDLENIIRKIVKEEVSIAVPKLIIELLQADKKNLVSEEAPVARRPVPPAPRPNVKKPVFNTKNPLLNEILAETDPGLIGEGSGPSVEMDGNYMMESVSVPGNTGPSVLDMAKELPADVGGFLTKNYAAIIKKADKIASQKRGGPL